MNKIFLKKYCKKYSSSEKNIPEQTLPNLSPEKFSEFGINFISSSVRSVIYRRILFYSAEKKLLFVLQAEGTQ